jgi:Glycosyl transferase family 2.
LIRHEHNKGKGEAMKTGVKEAQGENIIFIDADNTYPVEVIPDIAQLLQRFDMVGASRSRGRENIPRFNRTGNFIFSHLIRCLHGSRVKDPLTGLYGIKKAHFERMQLNSNGFSIETEIAIKAARMKLKVTEIPIEYSPRLGNKNLAALQMAGKY